MKSIHLFAVFTPSDRNCISNNEKQIKKNGGIMCNEGKKNYMLISLEYTCIHFPISFPSKLFSHAAG